MALSCFNVDPRFGGNRCKLPFLSGKGRNILCEKAVRHGRLPEMQAALCTAGLPAAADLSADSLHGVLVALPGEFLLPWCFRGGDTQRHHPHYGDWHIYFPTVRSGGRNRLAGLHGACTVRKAGTEQNPADLQPVLVLLASASADWRRLYGRHAPMVSAARLCPMHLPGWRYGRAADVGERQRVACGLPPCRPQQLRPVGVPGHHRRR